MRQRPRENWSKTLVTHKRQRRLVIKSGSQRHVLDSRNAFVCAHACLQSSPVLMSVQSAVYKRIKRIERIQTRQAQVKASPPLPAKHLPLWLTCNCCRLGHGLTKASHSHARHLLLQSALLGRSTRVVRQPLDRRIAAMLRRHALAYFIHVWVLRRNPIYEHLPWKLGLQYVCTHPRSPTADTSAASTRAQLLAMTRRVPLGLSRSLST